MALENATKKSDPFLIKWGGKETFPIAQRNEFVPWEQGLRQQLSQDLSGAHNSKGVTGSIHLRDQSGLVDIIEVGRWISDIFCFVAPTSATDESLSADVDLRRSRLSKPWVRFYHPPDDAFTTTSVLNELVALMLYAATAT